MNKSAQRGFTLIELLVVIAIIGLLATIILASLNGARRSARSTRAIADLRELTQALELYYNDHQAYPDSGGNWDGLYSCWGDSTSNWIAGLTPTYIAALPRSPNLSTDCDNNYIYFSNGTDYKLIWHNAENQATVVGMYPNLIDPVRPTWAYGFYSSGGVAF